MTKPMSKILVIKLGALGDFIQALGPMAAVRKHHPEDEITLLTTEPFKGLAKKSGYFDNIWIDTRPKFTNIKNWIGLKKELNQAGFWRIYDFQNNDRTSFYFKLLEKKNKPEWVGTAKGASHRNASSERTAGHAIDGHIQTLKLAGIIDVQIDTLDWIEEAISSFALKKPYVLLVPGSAPDHPEKRWPADKYRRLAKMLNSAGYQPVLLGTDAEKEVTEKITTACPQSLNLTGQTSFAQIAVLARGAAAAIGNDTGPMHLIAPTGCPSLTLFSQHSNPMRHAPKGENVIIIQKDNLETLNAEEVLARLNPRDKQSAEHSSTMP